MIHGLLIKTFSGTDGTITVPGLGAVAAEFQSWKLVRREEEGTGGPYWTLHASFRFQTDLLLMNESLKKRTRLVIREGQFIDLCGWEKATIQHQQGIFEGVIQCPQT